MPADKVDIFQQRQRSIPPDLSISGATDQQPLVAIRQTKLGATPRDQAFQPSRGRSLIIEHEAKRGRTIRVRRINDKRAHRPGPVGCQAGVRVDKQQPISGSCLGARMQLPSPATLGVDHGGAARAAYLKRLIGRAAIDNDRLDGKQAASSPKRSQRLSHPRCRIQRWDDDAQRFFRHSFTDVLDLFQ